jgi:hypothetical protein
MKKKFTLSTYAWKSLFEKALGKVCRVALQKKILLTGILLTNVLIASFSQKESVLLSTYDSCHVQPPQQTAFALKAAGAGPRLRVAYVIPSNRTAQPDGVANLQHAIKLGQKFFKDQMEQYGFGAKTYTYETDADGVTPLIHVVQVAETDEYLRGDIWSRTMQAASNAGISLWAEGEVWVVIPETHVMLPDATVPGGVALGSGYGSGSSPGVSMIGSNALPLFRPEMMTDDTPYHGKVVPELGPYPLKQDVSFAWFEGTTFSSLASSWMGALWHETGHAFGLPHDFRNDNNFHGNLMGNGLRGTRGTLFPEKYPLDYTRLEYASALVLNVSHYFNRDKIVTYGTRVSTASPASVIPQQGLVHISFQASAPDGLSFAYLRHAGDMVAEIVLQGNEVDTAFAVPYFTPGVINQYTIAVYDKQGSITPSFVEFDVPSGNNHAPIPFIRIDPPVPVLNQSITLNATQSYDVDHNQATLLAAWDVNNDGRFDIEPSTNQVVQYHYENPGSYLIRLKLTDPLGAETISTAVSIKIPGEKKITVESFTLMDADKDEAVAGLEDGQIIQQTAWEGKTFSVRANTSQGMIDRVEFNLQGPIAHEQIDRELPYALFGDNPKGNFIGRALVPGDYTLTATPFYASEKGIALTVLFKVKANVPGQPSIDKTLGGTGVEQLRSVIPASDGGFLLAGNSDSNISGDKSENSRGGNDYWIVKVDAQYNKQWDKTFGGEDYEYLHSVVPTQDGGYLLCGSSNSGISGDKTVPNIGSWVVKIDSKGNKIWDKTFGDDQSKIIGTITPVPDGYLLGGRSPSESQDPQYWVMKIDNQGNEIWDKSFGGDFEDLLSSVTPGTDGGYLLGGTSFSGASGDKTWSGDYWVVKIDDHGNKVWDKTFGGFMVDWFINAISTHDGGFLLAGWSRSDSSADKSENSKGGSDFWVVKIDADGNKTWDKTLGGTLNEDFASVVATRDGGYLLSGSSNSYASGDKSEYAIGLYDYWAVRIDGQGNKVWDKTLGGAGYDFNYRASAILSPAGGYLLSGDSQSRASGDKSEDSKGDYDYWIVELQEPPLSILSFSLINEKTGAVIQEFKDSLTLDLATLSFKDLAIQAHTFPEQVGSVEFSFDNKAKHTENVFPYTFTLPNHLKAGTHTIKADVYSEAHRKGEQGTGLTAAVIVKNSIAVVSYDIVNTSGKFLRPLNEGDILYLDDLKDKGQTIVANTTGQIGSVKFDLNNKFFMMQNALPYTLTGDNYGTYFKPWIPKAGAYTLTATPYSKANAGGDAGQPLTIHFTVKSETAVVSYDIVNTSGKVLRRLNDGDVLNADDLKDKGQTIVANTTGKIGSVKFSLNNKFFSMQNASPYTLTGDNYGTYFVPWKPHAGSYTLTATPYSKSDGGGSAGKPLTIHFTVKPETAVVSYDIVNTSGKVQRRLNEGDVLNSDDLKDKGQTIVANTTGKIGSVKFSLNNKFFSMQNAFPYTLTGDNYGTYFVPWKPHAGSYTLTATPYSKSNAAGNSGKLLTIHFTVVDRNNDASRIAAGWEEDIPLDDGASDLTIYPVPVENELFVKMDDTVGKDAMLSILNLQGLSMYQGTYSQSSSISTADLKPGVYVLQVVSRNGFQRLVKFIKK